MHALSNVYDYVCVECNLMSIMLSRKIDTNDNDLCLLINRFNI